MDNGLELLDTPGILWPKFEDQSVGLNLAFTGAVKDDIMDLETLASHLMKVLAERYPDAIQGRYKIEIPDQVRRVGAAGGGRAEARIPHFRRGSGHRADVPHPLRGVPLRQAGTVHPGSTRRPEGR